MPAVGLGSGIQLSQQRHRHRAEQRGRDLVVGKRLAGERVAQLARDRGEVAAAHRRGRDQRGAIGRLALLVGALVGAEEERAVVDDRSAERAAVLIALEAVALSRREEVGGVHVVVAQVAERDALETVGARAGDGVDDGARRCGPYSALKLLVWTLNSCSASGFGIGFGALL